MTKVIYLKIRVTYESEPTKYMTGIGCTGSHMNSTIAKHAISHLRKSYFFFARSAFVWELEGRAGVVWHPFQF